MFNRGKEKKLNRIICLGVLILMVSPLLLTAQNTQAVGYSVTFNNKNDLSPATLNISWSKPSGTPNFYVVLYDSHRNVLGQWTASGLSGTIQYDMRLSHVSGWCQVRLFDPYYNLYATDMMKTGFVVYSWSSFPQANLNPNTNRVSTVANAMTANDPCLLSISAQVRGFQPTWDGRPMLDTEIVTYWKDFSYQSIYDKQDLKEIKVYVNKLASWNANEGWGSVLYGSASGYSQSYADMTYANTNVYAAAVTPNSYFGELGNFEPGYYAGVHPGNDAFQALDGTVKVCYPNGPPFSESFIVNGGQDDTGSLEKWRDNGNPGIPNGGHFVQSSFTNNALAWCRWNSFQLMPEDRSNEAIGFNHALLGMGSHVGYVFEIWAEAKYWNFVGGSPNTPSTLSTPHIYLCVTP